MTKASASRNLGRSARKQREKAPPPGNANVDKGPEKTEAPPVELTAEEQVTLLSNQVGTIRNFTYGLLQKFAAARVAHGEIHWDAGTEFINVEAQRLEAELASMTKRVHDQLLAQRPVESEPVETGQ